MQHQKSDVTVYETKDYSRFRMINGNRALNTRKIDRIMKDIRSGNNMLRYKPIEVKQSDSHLDILDGQHRMFISQKIAEPVYYILVEENKSMNEIATVNSNVEKWKYSDYINCYINQGNDNYQKLQDFVSMFKTSVGSAITLLTKGTPISGGGDSNHVVMENFYRGTFEIIHWDEAVHIGELAKSFSGFQAWNNRNFMAALCRIEKAGIVSIEDFIVTINKNIDKLTTHPSSKGYINNLEQIMNIGKQKRYLII